MDAGRLFYNLFVAAFMPPANFVLLGLIGLAVMGRRPRLGRWLTAIALLCVLLISLPLVANPLLASLELPYREWDGSEADAVVVLGGGIELAGPEYGSGPNLHGRTLERVRYAALLYRRLHKPILVTGGAPDGGVAEAPVMRRVLEEEFGVPVTWVEDRSLDTRQNAEYSARMLVEAGIRRIYLVSHAWHVSRAVPEFQRQGFAVVPAGTGFRPRRVPIGPDYVPSPSALANSYYAFHEWMGTAWYRLKSP